MTQLLERAINQLQSLPANEQDAPARWILERIDDDRAWDESFARSQDALSRLAAKARGYRRRACEGAAVTQAVNSLLTEDFLARDRPAWGSPADRDLLTWPMLPFNALIRGFPLTSSHGRVTISDGKR